TSGALLDQATTASGTSAPLPSRAVATRLPVLPTVSVSDSGERVISATPGRLTVTETLADTPSLVAVIAADPMAMAVTLPASETATTPGALLVQLIGAPGITAPSASRAVATSVRVSPVTRAS